MNKISVRAISLSLIIAFPLSVCAQEKVIAPPIFVRPVDNISLQQQNNKKEYAVKQLIDQNISLQASLEQQKRSIEQDLMARSNEKSYSTKILFTDAEQFSRLKKVLNNYRNQIDERDQIIALRDVEITRLQAKIQRNTQDINEAIEASKAIVNKDAGKSVELNNIINERNDMVAKQSNLLIEKSNQLVVFKEQLVETKEELRNLNNRYADLKQEYELKLKDTSNQTQRNELLKKIAEKIQVIDQMTINLKNQNLKFEEMSNALRIKDERLTQLNDLIIDKDQQIIDLKNAHVQVQELKDELSKDDAAFVQIKEKGIKLKDKIFELEQQVSIKEDFITELKSQLVQAKNGEDEQIQKLQKDLENSQKQVGNLTNTIKALNLKIADSSVTTDESQIKITQLQEQIKIVQTERDTFIKEISVKNSNLEDIKQKLISVQQEQQNVATQMKSTSEILNQKLVIIQEEKQKQLAVSVQEKQGLEGQIQQLKINSQNTETTLAQALERMKLREELTALHKKHIALLNERNRLVQVNEHHSLEHLKQGQEQHFLTITELQTKNKQQEEQLKALQATISSAQDNAGVLKARIQSKTEERDDIKRILDKFQVRLKENLDVTEDQAQSIANYRMQMQGLEDELSKARIEADRKQQGIDVLRQDLASLQKDVSLTRQQLRAKELSLSMVQGMLDEKAQMHEVMVLQFKDQLKLKALELEKVKEGLVVAETKLKQADHSEELSHVQEMLKSSREEIVMINELLKQKETQLVKLQNDLDVNSKEFVRQNKDIENLRLELQKLYSNINQLKENLRWKDKEITRLKLKKK